MNMTRDALSDRAYDVLRSRIIDLELAPGERLTMERLTSELGVSHTPIREALNRLATERLVSVAPYRGFTVTPLLDAEGLRQLLDARLVIELGALTRSAESISQDTLDELEKVAAELDALAAAGELDVRAFNELDGVFHHLTIVGSGNTFLVNAFDDLRAHVQIARHFKGRSVAEARQAQAEHRRLLDALVRHDREAALREATLHVGNVYERLQGLERGSAVDDAGVVRGEKPA